MCAGQSDPGCDSWLRRCLSWDFLFASLSLPLDLERRLEDGGVTPAHSPLSETLGQMGFRFQNLFPSNGHTVHLS